MIPMHIYAYIYMHAGLRCSWSLQGAWDVLPHLNSLGSMTEYIVKKSF